MRVWNSHPLQSERNWTPEQLSATSAVIILLPMLLRIEKASKVKHQKTLNGLVWIGMLQHLQMNDYVPFKYVDVPFNDDVFQNSITNVNALQYSQVLGKFPPGKFPPISLIIFLHYSSLNTSSINGQRIYMYKLPR